ncbi:MAG: hydrogenase maturation protease [Gammaproteobacteria bacterium]
MGVTPVGRVVVLGIGSPHGADDLGWRVVESLGTLVGSTGRNTSILCRNLSAPDGRVLEALAGAGLGIVVDAVHDPERVGGEGSDGTTLERFADLDLFAQRHAFSSHGLGLAEVLRLGRALGDLPEPLWIYGLRVGEGPPPDEARLQGLVRALLTDIEAWLDRAGQSGTVPG